MRPRQVNNLVGVQQHINTAPSDDGLRSMTAPHPAETLSSAASGKRSGNSNKRKIVISGQQNA